MKILHTHTVGRLEEPIRFIDYAKGYDAYIYTFPSRQGLKKAIEKGAFLIDGIQGNTGTWLKEGQRIDWLEIQAPKMKQYNLDLEVIYEDPFFAIINKPAGILVSGNQFKTVANALLPNLKPSDELDALAIPRPVHRLDRLTSGLLLIAKTSRAQIELSNQFKHKTIRKKYRAIVQGAFPENGIINELIEGMDSSTKYQRIGLYNSLRNELVSLVELFPETGRTHQLRIHTSGMGHPIIGDKLYTKEGEVLKGKGLFLSAIALELNHPIDGRPLSFEIPQPNKFDSFIEREARRWEKFREEKE